MRNLRRGWGRSVGRAVVTLSLAAVAAIQFASSAHAYSKRVQQACLADYKNLCPQYRVNSPQLRACMESKSSSISWGCIEALMDSGELDRRRVTRR